MKGTQFFFLSKFLKIMLLFFSISFHEFKSRCPYEPESEDIFALEVPTKLPSKYNMANIKENFQEDTLSTYFLPQLSLPHKGDVMPRF